MPKQTITWTNETRRLSELIPWPRNPRQIKGAQVKRLQESYRVFGQPEVIAIGPENNEVYNGHQRLNSWLAEFGDIDVDVRVASRPLSEKEREKLTIYLHAGAVGEWDFDLLSDFEIPELEEWGFDMTLLGLEFDDLEPAADPGAQIDRAEELREKWDVQPGQLWKLGAHRLICGDCTDPAVVERVMGGEKAILCHADPPYGMGKENDGIANDNLYREKLDAFQMQWWRACRPSIEDNGSAYIWGNAEDLWRLWYCGGLKDSERLTFRNCIAWDKYNGNVKPTQIEMMRSYVVYREDCLFFMLGEQGFNNNADNYWEGWEPIRVYLKEQRDLMGWDNKIVADMFGFHPRMASHWFDESQWTFIREEQYKTLQAAAKGDAFKREHDELKREHDELKREFYETRAYFDNTHDNMTDVWSFGRVQGEDRHDHATPKPVEMMARAIKSSSPAGAIVYAPFNGTGPELIACEQLGRKCRAVEISPAYCAVAIDRWATMTGGTPQLVTN